MIGKSVCHYRILEKLGEGGMGVVYKAEDTKLKRQVAIKFLPRPIALSDKERARFKIEAQAAAALNHPNITTIYAIEEDGEELFIVMEYIEGRELREILKSGIPLAPFSGDPLSVIDIATQIAAGLQAAHTRAIVHRDIKSSNIMVTDEGKVKIMDFGLAKMHGAPHMTQAGSTVGTPYYMSPEQARGEEVDARTDIWSFGIVLYEMLTGELPFEGDYEQAIIYGILNEKVTPLIKVNPEAPHGFQTIIDKALAKDVDQRYQSAAELADDLQAISDGHQIKRRYVYKSTKAIGFFAALVMLILGMVIYFFAVRSPSTTSNIKTIAVLPFINMSSDPDQEYFSDGLTEELLNVLAKNPRLRVTSRTSAFSFKNSRADIKTIAARLKVKHILEGSVRKSGKMIRITVQLIDVNRDAHIWSETYDRRFDDVFAVQESISKSVAEALNITLLGKNQILSDRETNPEAYNAFLKGEHLSKMNTAEGLKKAIRYYEQALSIDPNYAPAWSGLSAAHTSQADLGYAPVEESYRLAKKEVERALELNPHLASAYSGVGWIKQSYDWDWRGADAAYRKARELEPGNAEVLRGAAVLASTMGRFQESVELSQQAIELDPINTASLFNLGLYNYYVGSFEEAREAFKKSQEINPQFPLINILLGQVFLAEGKPDSALLEISREKDSIWRLFGLAITYHDLGRKQEADSLLAKFINTYANEAAYQIAEIYAYRGEIDQAFEWLDRAYDQRDGGLAEIKGDPLLKNLEDDPRFVKMMKKMKLPI